MNARHIKYFFKEYGRHGRSSELVVVELLFVCFFKLLFKRESLQTKNTKSSMGKLRARQAATIFMFIYTN